MRYIFGFISLLIVISCSQNQGFVSHTNKELADDAEQLYTLQINEFSPKSNSINEFKEESDWIEIYNFGDEDFLIESGTWSISDDENSPEKYFIPESLIPAKGYLIIWCDGRNISKKDFHSNFKLSGKGERISLYHNGNLEDEIKFDEDVKKKVSYGRVNEKSDEWTMFKYTTIGCSNQSSDNYAESLK